MSEPLVEHVSDTAFMVAHHRALESARTDALFRDPLAARLAGDKGKAVAEAAPAAAMTGWMVSLRTVVIDDLIRAALGRGVDLVVNVGAGLDTRPYRLDVPADLSWVEIDFPDVVAYKERQLGDEKPRCRLERIGLDLSQAAERRALFTKLDARAKRLLVLTEGVVPYLDNAEAGALADDLRALTHLDGWIVDYTSPEAHAYRERTGLPHYLRKAPFKFQPADWFGFFAEHGWKLHELRYLPAEGERLKRPPPLPWRLRLLLRLLGPLIRRRGGNPFQRSLGYALLVPAGE